jgi:hypothetical protein
MYVFLDFFFITFHASLILFILIGWVWPKTRRLHLLVIMLTVSSWFGLGFFYGFGYCPSTDWHWRVKEALGETDLPDTYVKYYLDRMTGFDWDPTLVGSSILLVGLTALGVSISLNWRDWRQFRAATDGNH